MLFFWVSLGWFPSVAEESCHIKIETFVSQKSIEKKAIALDSGGKFLGENSFCDKLSQIMRHPPVEIHIWLHLELVGGNVQMTLVNKFYNPILAETWN